MISRILRRQMITNKYAFSSNTAVDIALKIHYPEGYAKLFNIKSDFSANDVQKLIRDEEGDRFRSLKLIMGSKDYINEDIPFIDFVIHNPVSLVVDGQKYAYEVNPNGPANYLFDSQGFENEFNKLEVPYQDALVITKFYKLVTEMMSKQNPGKSLHNQQEVESGIKEAIHKFAEKNQTTSQFWMTYSDILTNLNTDLLQKEAQIMQIRSESKEEGHKLLKQWIAISVVQYLVLLLFTYGLYSWNTSEPISYLLAQGLETLGIYYFIRKGFHFRQSTLYMKRYTDIFSKRINTKQNSSNYLKEVASARDKVNMVRNKIAYGTTSH